MRFPSREWCEEAIRLVNEDPQSALAGRGWKGDIGLVVEAEPGRLGEPFVVYCDPKDGRIERIEVLPDPDDLDDLEPAYRIQAPYSVWKGLLLGTLDPMEALLRRHLRIQGDVQPLIERVKYRPIADRVLARMQTEFADQG